ncbi:hypothetical protein H839_08074 [Parageobacillus genomosp. 1]|uniref:Uncharacterized protein n=1 Tax=Parageobacillus genomosp. 1 TaxID=1295642 RepID=A0ABC9VGM6_9BACL|nr:hypothetical protein [Parageobacillus genomosp. 1]EZP77574.1 hypothetical protein H839_08074 [Parageobacillus genomosp. 1]
MVNEKERKIFSYLNRCYEEEMRIPDFEEIVEQTGVKTADGEEGFYEVHNVVQSFVDMHVLDGVTIEYSSHLEGVEYDNCIRGTATAI